MTPDKYGYALCSRCGSLRPATALVTLTVHRPEGDETRSECADMGYCTRAAGVGHGRLEVEASDG